MYRETVTDRTAAQTNDFIRKIWLPRTLMSAGRYTRESAIERVEQTGELIAFGRRFISNVRCSHHFLVLSQLLTVMLQTARSPYSASR